MAGTKKGTITRATWDDRDRRWSLGGMAEAMNDWLERLVAGSAEFRGWQLAGTLNPRDPNPVNYKPPPEWLSPRLLMESASVWYAGAMQDYLFSNGLVPLARLRIDADGSILSAAGAAVEVAAGRIAIAPGPDRYAYYVVVNQEGNPYPLGEGSTISITPRMSPDDVPSTVPAVVQARASFDDATAGQVGQLISPGELPFAQWSGWGYCFTDFTAWGADVVVHV